MVDAVLAGMTGSLLDLSGSDSASAVSGDFSLPLSGSYGTEITWVATGDGIEINPTTGKVKVKTKATGTSTATLTPTVKKKGGSSTSPSTSLKPIEIVIPPLTPDKAVEGDIAAIPEVITTAFVDSPEAGSPEGITGDFTLPTTGDRGTTIAWESSDPGVISVAGTGACTVLPETTDTSVTLTATVTKDGETAAAPTSATVTVKVKGSGGGGGGTTTTYTVTFDSQLATTAASPATKTVTGAATTVAALPSDPVKTDNTFEGWYTAVNGGGSQFLATTKVTASLTVFAKWTPSPVLVSETPSNKLANAAEVEKALTEADYTPTTWSAITTALALPESSDAEKTTKAKAIDSAIAALVPIDITVAKLLTFDLPGLGDAITSKEVSTYRQGGVPGGPPGTWVRVASVSMMPGHEVTTLTPVFHYVGSKVSIKGVAQSSGLSVVDFTKPVIYTVTSADGTVSNDYTVTVVSKNPDLSKIAVDSTGQIILASLLGDGHLFRSTDGGTTWTSLVNSPKKYWSYMACSADGSLIACEYDDFMGGTSAKSELWMSSDSGASWYLADGTTHNYSGMCLRVGGSTVVVQKQGGDNGLFISTDKGKTFSFFSASTTPALENFESVSLSADGSTLFTVANQYVSASYYYPITVGKFSGTAWTWVTQTQADYFTGTWTSGYAVLTTGLSNDGSKLAMIMQNHGTVKSQLLSTTSAGLFSATPGAWTATNEAGFVAFNNANIQGSSDLSKIYAIELTTYKLFKNSGLAAANWQELTSAPSGLYNSQLIVSADGTKLIMLGSNPSNEVTVRRSVDSGLTWADLTVQ